jgi:hypothetical protein
VTGVEGGVGGGGGEERVQRRVTNEDGQSTREGGRETRKKWRSQAFYRRDCERVARATDMIALLQRSYHIVAMPSVVLTCPFAHLLASTPSSLSHSLSTCTLIPVCPGVPQWDMLDRTRPLCRSTGQCSSYSIAPSSH